MASIDNPGTGPLQDMELVHQAGLASSREPLVSVCIANFNGEELLGPCIDSVLAQTNGPEVEIIVHDDASTDRSVALLKARYPDITILESGANVGYCIANNRMAELARGQYLLLLNNDATLFPDALQQLLAAARDTPNDLILSLPQFDWRTGALIDRGCLLDPFYNPSPNVDASRNEVAYVIGACFWTSKRLWSDLGGFPEWMESIGEDLYLCCLARLRGARVLVLNASGYTHRQGASFGGNRASEEGLLTNARRRYLSERNKTATLLICTPTVFAWPLLALHLMALSVEGGLISLVRGKNCWRSIYAPAMQSTIAGLAALRQHRASAQAARRSSWRSYASVFRPTLRKLTLLRRFGLPKIQGL